MVFEAPALDVVAVGHAVVDRIGFVDDSVLVAAGLVKGSMRLVFSPSELAVEGAGVPRWQWAAGSAGNTAAGLALLGSKVGFVGRVGDDDLGAAYLADMDALGVELEGPSGRTLSNYGAPEPVITQSSGTTGPGSTGPGSTGPGSTGSGEGLASGQCLVLVTPDGERTMTTYLGASTLLSPADLPSSLVGRARVLYLEGYLWDSPGAVEAISAALESLTGPRPVVALSLSDPFCVERHRDAFLELIRNHVGLLFANESEILTLTGFGELDRTIDTVGDWGCVVAITEAAAGSVVVGHGEVIVVPAVSVTEVVDTTGAGDLYAAGFMHTFVAGASLEHCARLGSVAAAEVISHVGARPQASLRLLAEAAGLLPPADPGPSGPLPSSHQATPDHL